MSETLPRACRGWARTGKGVSRRLRRALWTKRWTSWRTRRSGGLRVQGRRLRRRVLLRMRDTARRRCCWLRSSQGFRIRRCSRCDWRGETKVRCKWIRMEQEGGKTYPLTGLPQWKQTSVSSNIAVPPRGMWWVGRGTIAATTGTSRGRCAGKRTRGPLARCCAGEPSHGQSTGLARLSILYAETVPRGTRLVTLGYCA